MPFTVPDARFDPAHMASATAPNCKIRLLITCHAGDCPAGALGVRVVEQGTGALLARGRVTCTGAEHPHDLDMPSARPLATVNAQIIFDCGAEEETGRTSMIWARCSR